MSKKHSRKEIITHLIELKTKEIEALEESREIFADGADLDEESSLELDDFAQQTRSTDSANNLEMRINQARNNLDYFKNIRPDSINEVTEGRVVFTNEINFVIGLAFKDFIWENKKFIGISTDAPIYEVLEGKKEGDKVEFNGVHYTIEEVI